MSNLYLVEKTITAYVLADSEQDAKEIELEESGCDVYASAVEVHNTSGIPHCWRESLPFADHKRANNLIIEELLNMP